MVFTESYESLMNIYVWLTMVVIFSTLVGIWLTVRSGDKYSIEDAHAEEGFLKRTRCQGIAHL